MSNSTSNNGGCAGWFKWIVGSFIALLGASGGIAAWASLGNTSAPLPAPEPIVITINNDGTDDESASVVAKQVAVTLPEEVPVATAVPTPTPIPIQPTSNWPSETDVKQFLHKAVQAETTAYLYLDSSYVSPYFAGAPLSFMESEIVELANNGVFIAKLYDETQSYTNSIRFVNENKIEVDSCEVWSQEVYNVWDRTLLGSDAPTLIPQTIIIEQFSNRWYITNILFYDLPAFCQ